MKLRINSIIVFMILIMNSFLALKFNYFNGGTTFFKEIRNNSDNNIELISESFDSKTGYAIIIGISDYPGSSYDLSFCDDDALGVYHMLIDDYNFELSNIIYLCDSKATKEAINLAFDNISTRIDSNDLFIFYYSGHGGATTDIFSYSTSISSPHNYPNYYDNYWSIYGGDDAKKMRVHFSRLETEDGYDYVFVGDSDLPDGYYYYSYTGQYPFGLWSGWVPVLEDKKIWINLYSDESITDWGFQIDYYEVEMYNGTHYIYPYDAIDNSSLRYYDYFLDTKLNSINCSEIYLIFDSCFSGGMILENQLSNRFIISACTGSEYSIEDSTLQHGCFTYYFLNSLESAYDINGDGIISMEERYDYCYSNTVSKSDELGYTQHPQEYDGIPGQGVPQPAISLGSYEKFGNVLNFSFNLYGNGLITKIFLVMACVNSTDVIYRIEDISKNAPTRTGFGYYENFTTIDNLDAYDNFGIFAEIQGNKLITIDNFNNSYDYDKDSVNDLFEIINALDPRNPDSDNDGLKDGEEIYKYNTDPLNYDTDGDGYPDGQEITAGTDPLDSTSNPLNNFLNILGFIMPPIVIILVIVIIGLAIGKSIPNKKPVPDSSETEVSRPEVPEFEMEDDYYPQYQVEYNLPSDEIVEEPSIQPISFETFFPNIEINYQLSAEEIYKNAINLLKNNNSPEAKQKLLLALDKFKKQEDLKGQAKCLMRLGDIDYILGDLENSRQYYHSASKKYGEINKHYDEIYSLIKAGNVSLLMGFDMDAIQYYKEALNLSRNFNIRKIEVSILIELANIYSSLNQLLSAYNLYNEALKILKQNNEYIRIYECLISIGDILYRMELFDKTIEKYQDAYNILKSKFQLNQMLKEKFEILRKLEAIFHKLNREHELLNVRNEIKEILKIMGKNT